MADLPSPSGHDDLSDSPASPLSPFSPFSPDFPQTPSSSSRADAVKARLERQIKRFRRDPESPSLLRLPPLSAEDLERQQLDRERLLKEKDKADKELRARPITIDSLPTIPQFGPIVIDLSDDSDDILTECPPSPRPYFSQIMGDDLLSNPDLLSASLPDLNPVGQPSAQVSASYTQTPDRPFQTNKDFVDLTLSSAVSRLDPPTHIPSYRRRLRFAGSGHKDDGDMDGPGTTSSLETRDSSMSAATDGLTDDPPSPFERRRKRWEQGRLPSISQVEGLYRPVLERKQFGIVAAPKLKRTRSSRGRSRSLDLQTASRNTSSGGLTNNNPFSVLYDVKPLPFLPDDPIFAPMTRVPDWKESFSIHKQKPQLLSRFAHKRKSPSLSALSEIQAPYIPTLPATYQPQGEREISPGGHKSLVQSAVMRRAPSISPIKSTFESDSHPPPPGSFTSAGSSLSRIGSALMKTVAKARQLDDPFTLGSLAPQLSAKQASPFDASRPTASSSDRKGKGRAREVMPEADDPSADVQSKYRTPPSSHSSASWKGRGKIQLSSLEQVNNSFMTDQGEIRTPSPGYSVGRKGKGKAREVISDGDESDSTSRHIIAKTTPSVASVDRKGKGKAREKEVAVKAFDPFASTYETVAPPTSSTSAKGKGKAKDFGERDQRSRELLEASIERLDQEQVELAIEASLLDQQEIVDGEGTSNSARRRQLEYRLAEIDKERRALGLTTSPLSGRTGRGRTGAPSVSLIPGTEELGVRQVSRLSDPRTHRGRRAYYKSHAGTLFQQRLGTTIRSRDSHNDKTSIAPNPFGAVGEPAPLFITFEATSVLPKTSETPVPTTGPRESNRSLSCHPRPSTGSSDLGSPEDPVLVSHFSDSSDDTIKAHSDFDSDSSSSEEIDNGLEIGVKPGLTEATLPALPANSPPRTSRLPRTVGPNPSVIRRGLGLVFQPVRAPSPVASNNSSVDSSGHLNRLFRRGSPARHFSTPSLVEDDASEISGSASLARSLSNQGSENWEEAPDTVEVIQGFRAHLIDAHLEEGFEDTLPPVRELAAQNVDQRTVTPHPARQLADLTTPGVHEYQFPMDIIHLAPSPHRPRTPSAPSASSSGDTSVGVVEVIESAQPSQTRNVPTFRFIDPTPNTSSVSLLGSPLAVPSESPTAPPFVLTDFPPPFNIMPIQSPGLDSLRLVDPAVAGGWRATRRASWASAEGSFDRAFTLLPSLMDEPLAGKTDVSDQELGALLSHEDSSTTRTSSSSSDVAALRRVEPEIDPHGRTGPQEWTRRIGVDMKIKRRLQDVGRKLGRAPVVSRDTLLGIAERAKEARQQAHTHCLDPGTSQQRRNSRLTKASSTISSKAHVEHQTGRLDEMQYAIHKESAPLDSKYLDSRPWQTPPSKAARGRRVAPSTAGLENLPDPSSPVGLSIVAPPDGDIPSPEIPDDNSMLSSKDAEYASGEDDQGNPMPRQGESEHDLARRLRRQYRRSSSEPLTKAGGQSDSEGYGRKRAPKRRKQRRHYSTVRRLSRSISLDEELGESSISNVEEDTACRGPGSFSPTRCAPAPPVGEVPASGLWTQQELARGLADAVSEYEAAQTGRIAMPLIVFGCSNLDEVPQSPAADSAPGIVRSRKHELDKTTLDAVRDGLRPITTGAVGFLSALPDVFSQAWGHLSGRYEEHSVSQLGM